MRDALTRARAEQYRRRAQECRDIARQISLETERAVILAETWLRLAEQQETEQPQQQQQIQPKADEKE